MPAWPGDVRPMGFLRRLLAPFSAFGATTVSGSPLVVGKWNIAFGVGPAKWSPEGGPHTTLPVLNRQAGFRGLLPVGQVGNFMGRDSGTTKGKEATVAKSKQSKEQPDPIPAPKESEQDQEGILSDDELDEAAGGFQEMQ